MLEKVLIYSYLERLQLHNGESGTYGVNYIVDKEKRPTCFASSEKKITTLQATSKVGERYLGG